MFLRFLVLIKRSTLSRITKIHGRVKMVYKLINIDKLAENKKATLEELHTSLKEKTITSQSYFFVLPNQGRNPLF